MMQPTNLQNGDHLALGWTLDSAWHRRVAFQREMRARSVIVLEVARQNPPQVSLVEHDQVVEALSAYGYNHSFAIGILPGRAKGNDHLVDTHVLDAQPEILAVDAVSIPAQETRCLVVGEGCPSPSIFARPIGRLGPALNAVALPWVSA